MGRIVLSQRPGVRAAAGRWRRIGRGIRDRDRVVLDRQADPAALAGGG